MTSPKSLLVIDDSEVDREIMALTLNAAFPEAVIRRADHPFAGKELCAEEDFDCVLLDYNMPDMDGLTLITELRREAAYLPIILMTSVGDEMLVSAALRNGASDYMPKSRLTAESARRAVDRSINLCRQSRLIDEQRTELENFAYALAHDFKQPIRQISTFTQLISEGMRGVQADELQQHLKFLGDAARRLGKLVDVMSQYTLLNQPPELADISVDQVVANVGEVLGPYLAERGAQLVAPARAARIRGNETLMTQILQNLVMNGLLYNQSSTPRVEVTAREAGDHWVIEIKDNGIGIEAQYLAEIFKPLVRLHTSSEYAGSGLGLTLARKAVVAQKGAIWCESTPGQGSTFHIRLPAARESARGPKAEKERVTTRRRRGPELDRPAA
jgi:signal transduction histidine kinase